MARPISTEAVNCEHLDRFFVLSRLTVAHLLAYSLSDSARTLAVARFLPLLWSASPMWLQSRTKRRRRYAVAKTTNSEHLSIATALRPPLNMSSRHSSGRSRSGRSDQGAANPRRSLPFQGNDHQRASSKI